MSSASNRSIPAPSTLVVVSLGSNLGSPAENVIRGAGEVEKSLNVPIQLSSLWSSEPVDCPPGSPSFVNAILTFLAPPTLSPQKLLGILSGIEQSFGRSPKKALNEPRPLDLDIVVFGGVILSSTQLTLPHPRSHQRRFVLAPLAELAPELVLPGQSQSIAALLAALPAKPAVRKLG